MDPQALRIFVYDYIVATGRTPTSDAIAKQFGVAPAAARDAVKALKIGKTVLPDAKGEVWMAGPFSRDKTPYRVVGRKVSWWGNCAWDALGVAVIVGEDVRVETVCTDCRESMTIDVDHQRGPTSDAVVHFLVPAPKWYDDLAFT